MKRGWLDWRSRRNNKRNRIRLKNRTDVLNGRPFCFMQGWRKDSYLPKNMQSGSFLDIYEGNPDLPESAVEGYFSFLKQHENASVCEHPDMQEFEAAESTCRTPGNSAYWYCPDCETYFSDANGENEIAEGSWALALDPEHHTPAEAVKENDNSSTCKELGSYESVVYCAECKEEISRDTVNYTEYAAHTPKDAVKENDTPSTCKALGSYDSVVYCNVCGDEISRETVNYTEYAAHTPAEAVKENVVAATCTEAGSYEEVICWLRRIAASAFVFAIAVARRANRRAL